MKTQCDRVLNFLRSGRRLTQYEALNELGIMRLASRISDLKKEGHQIKAEMVEVQNRWGESSKVAAYWLEFEQEGQFRLCA